MSHTRVQKVGIKKVAGLYEIDADTALASKVDALTHKLDLLVSNDQGVSLNS